MTDHLGIYRALRFTRSDPIDGIVLPMSAFCLYRLAVIMRCNESQRGLPEASWLSHS